ncbi:MAG: ABC transporter permease [Caedimonas sp.]|jgi:putative tryptophan/tyrosine transport system permease protein|nr:ABC transporter permease [Caedimonas sp.]
MNTLQILGSIEIGLIYTLVAIGVYITFKLIAFPDLTVDGSFTLGAAVTSAMISSGCNPWVTTLAAIAAGGMAGVVTGYLNVKWNILDLLAGILTMTALYSVNLRVMGRPNIAIIDEPTIFGSHSIIIVTLVIVIVSILVLTRFFASEFGLGIRAIGINPKVSRAYGINVGRMKIIALSISNAIVALSGALFAQSQGFADISMGMGTIVVGLAAVIIGEAIMFHPKRILVALVSCGIGSILYRIAITFALNAHDIGLEATDLNLITATIVALTMILPKLKMTAK